MRIEVFLQESPMFAVSRAARRFDQLAAKALAGDGLTFMEGLVLAAIFFDAPAKPSQLADTFSTTRGNISHCISSLEAKGMLHRMIDPQDARSYLLELKPQGKRTAQRVIRTLDRLQSACEKQAGEGGLREMLVTLQKLEALAEE